MHAFSRTGLDAFRQTGGIQHPVSQHPLPCHSLVFVVRAHSAVTS